MDSFDLQLHITKRCNLRCSHCYQDEEVSEDMSLEQFATVLDQYRLLLDRFGVRGHMNITGGEPLLHPQLWDMLAMLSSMRDAFSFGVLTNGTFLNPESAQLLADYGSAFVQVSLDGDEGAHDAVRGAGNHRQVLEAIRMLNRVGLKTTVSFTAHSGNVEALENMVASLNGMEQAVVWTDRMVPIGGGGGCEPLTPKNVLSYVHRIAVLNREARQNRNGIEVVGNRALQFLATGGIPYQCKAGYSFLTVMENGEVYPCRRMPIPVGNLFRSPLCAIYDASEVLLDLQQRKIPPACSGCRHREGCRGGARCIAYALLDDYRQGDPGCPICR